MTTTTIQTLTRRFRFRATVLEDIDPSLDPAEIIKLYIPSYPFLAHATLGEPVVEGDTLVYPIEKREVQTKGARKPSPVSQALAALDSWAASASNPTPRISKPWQDVRAYVDEVIEREATPITDAFMVPML